MLYWIEAYSGWVVMGGFAVVALACWFYPTQG